MSPFATEHRPSRLRWAAVAALLCALVAAVAVAAWPASAADTAYDDGKRVGVALADLRDAETYDDVDESLTEVRAAAADARDHAGDELSEQMTEQGDALSRALNGFDGAVSADSEWDQELYELELDVALTDLSDQAEEFRAEAPEVEQAFYDGLQEGLQA
jgi:chemotaxis regulatin CheY-phosphate phosphatase CheZ